ncbi:hypothetical protein P3S72_15795 [Pseudomonas sp. D3]|uniref:hypothetical protein n=1 Tax=Pseudomonas sp. D3 TaxID=517398 RepID=UPI0023E44C60|nr:hypothetical protein [Pseudomonas sp. D3]WET07986.1 hypothetical protein P3S72_15795 [Pseudomonas sp. D3]
MISFFHSLDRSKVCASAASLDALQRAVPAVAISKHTRVDRLARRWIGALNDAAQDLQRLAPITAPSQVSIDNK